MYEKWWEPASGMHYGDKRVRKKSSSDQLSKVVFFKKKEKKSNVLLAYHSTDTYAKNRYICY